MRSEGEGVTMSTTEKKENPWDPYDSVSGTRDIDYLFGQDRRSPNNVCYPSFTRVPSTSKPFTKSKIPMNWRTFYLGSSCLGPRHSQDESLGLRPRWSYVDHRGRDATISVVRSPLRGLESEGEWQGLERNTKCLCNSCNRTNSESWWDIQSVPSKLE